MLQLALQTAHGRPDLQDSSFGEPPIGLTRHYFIAEKRDPAKANMGRCTLLGHLWNFRYRKCGAEKDRIYSLLGIARDVNDQKPDIRIDYDESKSFEEVFADATRKIVSAYKTLHILGMCYGPDVTEEGVLKRPSWVPTFMDDPLFKSVDSLTRYQWSETAFAATSDSTAVVEFPADSSMLVVEGYQIGTIKQLATEGLEKSQDHLAKVREALKRALDWTRKLSADHGDRYPDPIDAFWRTIITNRSFAAQKPTEAVEGFQFRHWWDILVLQDMTKFTPQRNLLAWKFQSLFLQRWPFRDFFVTQSGYIGMCGHARAYDDVVCLLPGSQVPFLLRRSKVEKDRYWMVGECYVHDIMEGSLWRKPEDWMKKETFHIK